MTPSTTIELTRDDYPSLFANTDAPNLELEVTVDSRHLRYAQDVYDFTADMLEGKVYGPDSIDADDALDAYGRDRALEAFRAAARGSRERPADTYPHPDDKPAATPVGPEPRYSGVE